MTIQFIRPLDIEQVRAKVEDRILDAERNYGFYLVLVKVMKKFEGKQITKRVANALQKELPDYTIFYDADYSMYHVRIGGNGISWDHRPSFLLGYKGSQQTASVDFFTEHNLWAYLEKERREKYIESREYLEALTEQWNTALATLQEIHADATQWGSTIEHTFDMPVRR